LPEGANLDDVTLEQALKMFELPRTIGTTADGQEIKANIGRFGPYIQVGKTFVSIKPESPFDITLEHARELYAAKLEKEANKYIQQFDSGIQVVNGMYGPIHNRRQKKRQDPERPRSGQAHRSRDAKMLLGRSACPQGQRPFYAPRQEVHPKTLSDR